MMPFDSPMIRSAIRTAALLLLAGPQSAQTENAPSVLEDPSFLVIVVDDIGTYDLYDDPSIETPALDTIRAGGATFLRAYVTSSMCSPSRTCLTGEYGRRHGIGRIIQPGSAGDLVAGTPTLATRLQTAGWRTCLVGKWHLSGGANYPLVSCPKLFGFDNWRALATFNLQVLTPMGSYWNWVRIDDGISTPTTEYATAAQADAAIEWWNENEGSAKFLWLAFNAPHSPYHDAPAPYYQGPLPVTTRDQYESAIEAIDNRIGHIVESIDLSNTYVFFWSDNGTGVGEFPPQQPGKLKQTMYEGGIRVPFFVTGPSVSPGGRRRLVSTVDLFQTILDLAGISGGTPDSLSFADELGRESTTATRTWVYAERFGPNFNPAQPNPMNKWRQRMVRRNDGWKLIVDESNFGADVTRELYDLQTDPLELTPRREPAIVAELQALLDSVFD